MNRMAQATFGNKGQSLEQASVANDRQNPGASRPVAGKRDAQDSRCSMHLLYGVNAGASCCNRGAFGHVACSPLLNIDFGDLRGGPVGKFVAARIPDKQNVGEMCENCASLPGFDGISADHESQRRRRGPRYLVTRQWCSTSQV